VSIGVSLKKEKLGDFHYPFFINFPEKIRYDFFQLRYRDQNLLKLKCERCTHSQVRERGGAGGGGAKGRAGLSDDDKIRLQLYVDVMFFARLVVGRSLVFFQLSIYILVNNSAPRVGGGKVYFGGKKCEKLER
jgi:hypothetical protein